jgi:hypothetical protein
METFPQRIVSNLNEEVQVKSTESEELNKGVAMK